MNIIAYRIEERRIDATAKPDDNLLVNATIAVTGGFGSRNRDSAVRAFDAALATRGHLYQSGGGYRLVLKAGAR